MIGHFLVIVCVLIIEQGFPYALQSPFMYTLLLECTSVHLAKGSLCIYRVFVGILSNFNLDLKTSYIFQCIKNVFDCFVKVPSFTTLYFPQNICFICTLNSDSFSFCFWVILRLVAGFWISIYFLALIFFSRSHYQKKTAGWNSSFFSVRLMFYSTWNKSQ